MEEKEMKRECLSIKYFKLKLLLIFILGLLVSNLFDRYTPQEISNYKNGYYLGVNDGQKVTEKTKSYVSGQYKKESKLGTILRFDKDFITIKSKSIEGLESEFIFQLSPEVETIQQISQDSLSYVNKLVPFDKLKIGDYVTLEDLYLDKASETKSNFLVRKIIINYNIMP